MKKVEVAQEYPYCREALYYLNAQKPIDQKLAYNATREALEITDTTVRRYFLAAIFHGMLVAKPTPDQIVGMLEASFSFDDYHPNTRPMLAPKTNKTPTITLMGSGKKGLKTVNISTLAAITASSSKRIIVTKPCTEAISSLTGSADFLQVLGIEAHKDKDKDKDKMRDIALKTGLGLFFVNSYMPQFMERYDGVFYAPHAMSYALAGLVSPFSTDSLLYGLALEDTALSYEVFKHYNITNPTVVSSTVDGVHFVDEALLVGKTSISTATNNGVYEFSKIIGGSPIKIESFEPAKSATKKDNVLKGLRSILPGSHSDLSRTIALNAGLIMYAGGVVDSIEQGYDIAMALIADGSAWKQLHEFVEAAHGNVELLQTIV